MSKKWGKVRPRGVSEDSYRPKRLYMHKVELTPSESAPWRKLAEILSKRALAW